MVCRLSKWYQSPFLYCDEKLHFHLQTVEFLKYSIILRIKSIIHSLVTLLASED